MTGSLVSMPKGMMESLKRFWKWTESPAFSYLTLFLLQLKVMWGVWKYRDLTVGDTAAYFARAYDWFQNFRVDIVWSPVYTAFYGSLLFFSPDPYLVTTLHRLIIVFALAMLVMAVMRRLLPSGIAWVIAAWWVVIPFNFDVFEVHLFAALPILGAWLLMLSKESTWKRGAAIAILFASSILIRNEMIIALGVLGIVCLWWEISLVHERKSSPRFSTYLISYGLPLAMGGLVCLFFYTRSTIQFPKLPSALKPKHTVNMCQVYAYGYKQRHPEWNKDHWTECEDLMLAQFGKKLPSLMEMIRRNPRAVLDHVLWNLRLLPNGIQLSLFTATSGKITPDYFPVPYRYWFITILSALLTGLLIIGLFFLYLDHRRWWKDWLKGRALGWLSILASLTTVFLIVIPTQRPRPEYMYSLTLFIMALTGMCIFAILQRLGAYKRLDRWILAIVVVLLIAAPSYYLRGWQGQPRRLLQVCQRLSPFQAMIASPNTVFLEGEQAFSVAGYLGHFKSKVLDYRILDQLPVGMPLETFLEKNGINLFYVDESLNTRLVANPLCRPFLISPDSFGWKLVAFQDVGDGKWMLLKKMP